MKVALIISAGLQLVSGLPGVKEPPKVFVCQQKSNCVAHTSFYELLLTPKHNAQHWSWIREAKPTPASEPHGNAKRIFQNWYWRGQPAPTPGAQQYVNEPP